MITERKAQGAYQRDIARELGVHPKTVTRALRRGAEPPRRKSGVRPAKLDPYKALIDQLLQDGISNASVILRRIREAGYTGGYTMLRTYIQPKRALRSKGVVRFETPPGAPVPTWLGRMLAQHRRPAPKGLPGRQCPRPQPGPARGGFPVTGCRAYLVRPAKTAISVKPVHSKLLTGFRSST